MLLKVTGQLNQTAIIIATDQPDHHSEMIQDRAKAMFPALGKPLIARVMEPLYAAGIRRFLIIVGMNEGRVAQYLHKSWKPDAEIRLVLQTPQDDWLSALRRAAGMVTAPVVLTTYTNFTHENFPTSLQRAYERRPAGITLAGTKRAFGPMPLKTAATVEDNLLVSFEDRPSALQLMDYAMLSNSFLEFLLATGDGDKYTDFWALLRAFNTASPQDTAICETAWVHRVISDYDLLLLNQRLLDDSSDAHILSELPLSVSIVPPVRVDPNVVVGENAVIGPRVYLESGSRVMQGAHLRDSVVLQRGAVNANAHIHSTLVTSRGSLT